MKKIYLIMLMILFSVFQAQIVNIPDPVLKAKLLAANVTNNTAQDINHNNIKIDLNSNNEIEVSEALTVYNLFLGATQNQTINLITNLSGVEAFQNLKYLNVDFNNLTAVDATSLPNLQQLHVSYNPITSLNANNLLNLKWLWCRSTQLTSLNISNLPSLEDLRCSGNQLTSLNLANKPNLKTLDCDSNNLSALNVAGLPNLEYLYFGNNPISSIDLTGLTKIKGFSSMHTNLQTINLNAQTNLQDLLVGNTPSLQYLFIKNGSYESATNFENIPNLKYACIDSNIFLENYYMQILSNYNGNHFIANSYCSFTPGGIFHTILGNVKYDSDNNGCSSNDLNKAFQKFNIVGTGGIGSFIADHSGNYTLPVQSGTHTVTPVIENPAYFTISPTSFTVNFPTQTSPLTQNFCLTANGTHNDLEVVIIPVILAAPGFTGVYKIIYKNKGTTTQSGNLAFNYNDDLMNYTSSTLAPASQSTGSLSWNFTNLLPFETREIFALFLLNTPTQTPALNGGDILHYTAQINGAADETPLDNTFTLHQTVVNSFDPNDKTCLEGTSITQAQVGDYVHYVIRFENTGTANAQNIVVKDDIDATKFDISSLVPLTASHSFNTKITGNTAEFIFENIQLPFNDATNDGYVSFKIKTKSTLNLGDSFSNKANIYFDYNAPIITNNYTTTVQNILGTTEINHDKTQFSTYPNPAKDVLFIKSKEKVVKAEIYDASGRILNSTSVTDNSVNVSALTKGNYIIKLFTKDKSVTQKFIKN
ncbi:conserved repeat domain-containing protein/Por secretion system C-terminal sorting domain-containing protein [Chryseobacterium soldanellicola]|uniref:Conserved repeat domain-containing protein/Por secretion system C-terminal sorting domain-containing protein n=1 Tax=Chryseobacterium soldanellicola TaxID=311333 RepID=A0A1H0YBA1_9FLAO|nr:leucine-rich repeat domain-containing protein [Chryseobacterium soldanellicola]SDQ12156.1 conserved repeat domain-containing protein/Por secretion system C-terminal sorting domain-containing protein [Chryseobacterium soldanellicola]